MPSENLSLDPTYILRHSLEKISAVAFVTLNNEELVCGGTEDGNIIFWELKCFRPLLTIQAHPGKNVQHLLSYAGDQVLSQGRDGWIRCWNQNGTQNSEWPCSEHLFTKMSLYEDSLAYSTPDECISVLDLQKGQSLHKVSKASGRGFLFSLLLVSSLRLALAYEDGNICLVHLPTQTEISVLNLSAEDPIFHMCFFSGSIAGISFQGLLAHLHLSEDQLMLSSMKRMKCTPSAVLVVPSRVSPPLTVVGSSQGTVRVCTTESQNYLAKLSYHKESIVSLSFSTNLRTLAAASKDKKISLWNMEPLS